MELSNAFLREAIKTSMKLHDCEAIEIESVEEVSISLESVKKALRKCQESNKRFP